MTLNDIFGVEVSYETKKKIEKIPFLIKILKIFEFYNFENEYADVFFKEVESDIKKLKDFRRMYNNTPKDIIDIERQQGNLWIYEIDMLYKKYSERYAPSYFFKYFNSSNKLYYFILRNEIDKLLDIKDMEYIL